VCASKSVPEGQSPTPPSSDERPVHPTTKAIVLVVGLAILIVVLALLSTFGSP
jgi:hypothetical protein